MGRTPGRSNCHRCWGRGGTITANGWTVCPCTRPTNPEQEQQARNAFVECARKWKLRETGFENIELALRGVLHFYTIRECMTLGNMSRREIEAIRNGQRELA